VSVCPLCGGKGEVPVRHIHFGDGVYKPETCMVCKGTGKVDVEPTSKTTITIIKLHGVWGIK
jgi:DnaJ-class molecular chaperone